MWKGLQNWKVIQQPDETIKLKVADTVISTQGTSVYSDKLVDLVAYYTTNNKLVGYIFNSTKVGDLPRFYTTEFYGVVSYVPIDKISKGRRRRLSVLYNDDNVRLLLFGFGQLKTYTFAIRTRPEVQLELPTVPEIED
jgi:hypothetical protein